MADAIKLSVTGDTQALVDAVRKGAVAVEDLQDVLKDAGKQGDRSGDDITDAMQGSQRDTKELKADIKRATDEFEKAGRASRDFGDNVHGSADKAKEGIEGLKDESQSTGREMAASFQGPEDALSAIQELAANALSGLGPAGIIAGGAAAVGIGFATAALSEQQEKLDALKEKFKDAYRTAAEEGQTFLDTAQIQSMALDLIYDTGRLKEAQEEAKQLGLDVNTVVLAQSGDAEALNGVLERTRDLYGDAADVVANSTGIYETSGDKQISALGRINDKYLELKGVQNESIAASQEAGSVIDALKQKESDQKAAAMQGLDAQTGKVQALSDRVMGLPNKTVTVGADLSPADRAIANWRVAQQSLNIVVNAIDSFGKKIK